MIEEVSSGVVVFRIEPGSGRRLYLLLHYEEGHWDYPKGHVEKGETELDAARRETEEETGISQLDFVQAFRESMGYFYKRDRKTFHKEVFFFLASTGQGSVKLSKEHAGFEWLGYDEAYARLTFPNAKEMLRKAEMRLRNGSK
jgi:8-oxo-dGTP pyrophosphatase MutT (NUDIX family)